MREFERLVEAYRKAVRDNALTIGGDARYMEAAETDLRVALMRYAKGAVERLYELETENSRLRAELHTARAP